MFWDHKDKDYLEQLLRITDGRGVDVIIEMLANINLAKDLNVIARDGTIVVVGSRGSVEIMPRDIMRNEVKIVGVMGGKPAELAEAHAAIGAGLRVGTLRPIVSKEIPLAEAARAHQEIMEHPALGKIVLVP